MKLLKFLFYFVNIINLILLIPITWILMPIYYKLRNEIIICKAIIDENWKKFEYKINKE